MSLPDTLFLEGHEYRSASSLPQLWRVPHDIERINIQAKDFRYGGNGFRSGKVRGNVLSYQAPLPEVYRCYPSQVVPLHDPWLLLWRNMNSSFSDEKFCRWLGDTLFLTNGTGFEDDRRNIILGKNLQYTKPPAFDETRLCGGAVIEGIQVGDRVYIRGMITGDPVPTTVEVVANKARWYWGTSVNMKGEINIMTKVGMDGNRYGCRVPILSVLPIWLPVNELHKLPLGSAIPDPRWMA